MVSYHLIYPEWFYDIMQGHFTYLTHTWACYDYMTTTENKP